MPWHNLWIANDINEHGTESITDKVKPLTRKFSESWNTSEKGRLLAISQYH